MKQTLLFAVLGCTAFAAAAQEVGQVLSSVPVIQQVAVPRTYCNEPQVIGPPQTSGAGGLMGAIAGGALGSTIGSGSGTAAAMLLGTIGGALIGNNIEAGGAAPTYAQPACGTETFYENRTVGYHVTYEYAGRQYQVQMPYDPGPTLPLQVTPVTSGTLPPPPMVGSAVVAPPIQSSTVIVPSPLVVPQYAAYPAYPPYPVYAPYPAYRPFPLGVSLSFGFHSGHRHHGHRHRHRH